MRNTPAIIFLFLIHQSFGQAPLFKISQNDRVGYIDEKGSIVIKPVFLNGNDFSEGLAAVRLNGTYGFINETGTFVIKPEYDFATNFINGITVVYKNEKPIFIDKSGNVVLPSAFKELTFLDTKKGIITTNTNKQGVMDVFTKKLLVDTVFSSIDAFNNGVAVVHEYTPPAKKQNQRRVAVIDSTGKFVVPFGKYVSIKSFYDGYASVELIDKKNKDGEIDGVIDAKGNLLFKRPYENNSYVDGDFHDGFAKINLYKYWIPEEKGITSTSTKDYEGFINLKGEVVFNDVKYKYVNDFSNGRAFIKEDNRDFILIDKNFKRVGNKEFRDVPTETFKNGYAIVQTEEGFGIIDTLGNFVTKSNYADIDRVGIVDGYFFFTEKYNTRYGIADLKDKIISEPVIKEFDRNGFVNGLIKVVIDDTLCYMNKSGNIVWQQHSDTSKALKPLNIDFMNRGYFYAYSTPKNTEGDNSGGWATSQNKPQKIGGIKFPDDSLAITINTNSIDTFATQYFGYSLFISNTTKDSIKFDAQDSRLYMKLQAQNSKGEWKDIEYLPSSWCGNSYHKIELETNAYWKFTIPDYHGEFKTKIRAELKYIDNDHSKTQRVVYSNIISGSINPGQFWNKRAYYPGGIMDPYND